MPGIIQIFGSGQDLTIVQMSARALVVFILTLIMIRISGRRSFGQRSPFDSVVTILLGATLSRAIVGASPFIPTIAAALVIVLLHRGLAWSSLRSPWLAELIDGRVRKLYKDGKFDQKSMRAALVSENDVRESVRDKRHVDTLDGVDAAILERNGTVSILKKPPV